MAKGWIKLHRKISENDMWTSEKFTRGQAWIDLLLLANYKAGYIRVSGQRIEVKRGVCGWSISRLSDRWKWGREKIRRFLQELENDGQIQREDQGPIRLIKIINYEKFQEKPETGGCAESVASSVASIDHPTDHIKNEEITLKNQSELKTSSTGSSIGSSTGSSTNKECKEVKKKKASKLAKKEMPASQPVDFGFDFSTDSKLIDSLIETRQKLGIEISQPKKYRLRLLSELEAVPRNREVWIEEIFHNLRLLQEQENERKIYAVEMKPLDIDEKFVKIAERRFNKK